MKWKKRFQGRLTGLTNAIARFPLTTLFLLAAAIVNAYGISQEKDVSELLLTFIVGAFLGAVFQAIHERYFSKPSARFVFMGAVILLTAGYYILIKQAPKLSMEIEIRTVVALFALLIAFIWIPVIKSKISFNKSFMITFKSLFNSLFFSGVIFAGVAIIISAFDLLIYDVHHTSYMHTANIVFVLFAPLYYLSLIPVFPGASVQSETDERYEKINTAAQCPKFLEILISYILIPLIAVFTLILVVYILKNLTGKFWTDNLLEPMLVTYAITVILVYILASEIDNKFTVLFRKIFPKVLVPIVLFQIAASALNIADSGVMHPRYFVILFGIFAAISGVLLSFLPVRKNGIIAALLIVFSLISIIPPVDAFTVSRASQVNLLKDTLERNQMLENGQIQANASIPSEDKEAIINVVQYLDIMGYTEKIDWMPEEFDFHGDFERVFGFHPDWYDGGGPDKSVQLMIDPAEPLNITGYDRLVRYYVYATDSEDETLAITIDGEKYQLEKVIQDGEIFIKLVDDTGKELVSFAAQQIFERYSDYEGYGREMLSAEDATFAVETEEAKLGIIVRQVTVGDLDSVYNHADLYVLIKIN